MRPQRKVTIPQAFAVGKYPVTFAEWDAAVAAGGLRYRPQDERWGRQRRPIINVSYDDAQSYVRWLSEETGYTYRLLSEAEWEYACRAANETAAALVCSGRDVGDYAWCFENARKRTHPVGEKKPNAFGLHDMLGNVWEWCADCWNESYNGAPLHGLAWNTGDCSRHVVRGGSWNVKQKNLRPASRNWYPSQYRDDSIGFRVSRTLHS